ncbi:MAG: dTMP kinase [Candidatus Ryanbacteria bacterium RIFCSPHIGHO2_02_FULL_45_43]|uniref:Thymidylate kinase n=1 Tax=Candidatus Ryanbacteria bacterium RIFCSPHIGHO2_01_45_13 TaxID=1802112 RepID=A0A1G2FTF5_9BACT|nr:MAG: dTMP kinase [Candidatus Ryanbacteria bacterium RIFCSPHIGHO2_01_45_13]OGZ41528.1 MAG: dTMP kinase [Candidatus Ryanbacteria bacterium RIFCSPHIGHO2_01_FULL_44_130]OGZ47995.1 MAG: dTMP kinase [Candidatus Ryanbacteria bacterium RIFCSPHIGHO2_02_FULL_45_43]OGZ50131.1 MAG: dTMP kinase [Candidatus Ryanbacteria bacterium RIFCSPHIGHO2_12_FULL_44_20]OGZ51133.1 MAG: dTMP kinase [Candidatus Ryanbacteria bacterium RIFCSPLOWO2_01_FULL_44_230]OGZ54421.1 MAG: dTMP kinase [Candidatus Ryanbacteria bacteri
MKGSKVFIVFEGGEFTGKTTQIKLLAEKLRAVGREVVVTKEPGGTPQGEKFKEQILSGTLSPKEELKLFLQDRRVHIENVIVPALSDGAIVLSDRFSDSTLAYQHYGRGLSLEFIEHEQHLVGGITVTPHLVLILDMSPQEAFKRAQLRGEEALSIFERENIFFHHRVREGFLQIAQTHPENHVIINAHQSRAAVARSIWETVEEKFIL